MRRAALILLAGLALASQSSAARAETPEPYSYPAFPTDQLTVEGDVSGTEVTPEGNLYTGWAELSFSIGASLVPWNQRVRTWEEGWLPVISSTQAVDGISYTLSAFADDVGGSPVDFVRVTARNDSPVTQTAHVGSALRYTGGDVATSHVDRRFRFVRPVAFSQLGLTWNPGADFDPDWRYGVSPTGLTRDGDLLQTYPVGAVTAATTSAPMGTTGSAPRQPGIGVGVEPPAGGGAASSSPATQGATGPTGPVGQSEATASLAPGEARTFDYKLAVVPMPAQSSEAAAVRAADYDAHQDDLVTHWRARLAPADILNVPDQKAQDAYRASLVQILGSRYQAQGQWVQAVNALGYHAFWLRDSAVMTHALDLVGLTEPAAQNLRFFGYWQRPNGQFISRLGQLDGAGQAIWGLSEHILRTHDRAFARDVIPSIDKAVTWIIQVTNKDRYGLLPGGDPNDNEYAAGHLLGDDFWAVAGLDSATKMALALRDYDRARAYKTERDVLRRSVVRAVQKAKRHYGGAVPPTVEKVPHARDWGNLWASYPARVLNPESPVVTATIRRVRASSREGMATYGGKQRIHSYLGFRVWQTQLLRHERGRVVQGLFDALAHTTSTHGAAEIEVPPTDAVQIDDNLGPHGWFAAEYVELLRNALVREDNRDVELFGAVSPDWVQPGKTVSVDAAPTVRGKLTATLTGIDGGAELTWRSELSGKGKLFAALPPGATGVFADGREVREDRVRLHGASGTISLRWRLPDPAATPSYAGAVARLRAAQARVAARDAR